MEPQLNKFVMGAMIAAAFAGGSGAASAAGFALIEQNATGIGNAFAGAAAVAEDASTIFFNPAGMTRLSGRQAVVALHAIDFSAKFSNSASSKPAAIVTNPLGGNGGDAGSVAAVPNGYFVMPINEKMTFGIGVNAPFGLKTEYDDTWAGRFQGIKSDLKTINVNPALSFKVNDTVSVGVGINYQSIEAELTNAVVLAPNTEGRTKLEADDTAWGWNAGILFQVGPSTRIGASYRSTIDYTLEGDVTTTTAAGTVVPTASGPANADVTLPDTFSVSVAHKMNDQFELLGDISLTRWSEIDTITIMNSSNGTIRDILSLDFDDSYRMSIGVNWNRDDMWTWRAGIAYDQTPVKNANTRTVRLPDNDRTWISLGAKYRLTGSAAIDFGFSHLMLGDADINFTRSQQTPGLTVPTPAAGTQSVVNGSYEGSVNILSIQYTQSF